MDEDLMKEYKNSKEENDRNTQEKDTQNTSSNGKKPRFNIIVITFVALFVWLLVNNRAPAIADNYIFKVFVCSLIGLPFILYAVFKKEKAFIPLRISLILLGLRWFVPFFISNYKICVIVDLIAILVSALSVGLSFLRLFGEYKNSRLRETAVMCLAINFLMQFNDTRGYNYLSGKMAFWLPSIIGGAVFAGIAALLLFTGKLSLKGNSGLERGVAVALAGCCAYIFIWCGVQHLNYALDDGEPQKIEQVITDKRKDTSGDSTDYYLIVEIDGEKFEISVGSRDYKSYEKGDTLSFYYFDGAFDEPFYRY